MNRLNIVKSEEVYVLEELEHLIGKPILPLKEKIGMQIENEVGMQIEKGIIIKLSLYDCGLTKLPDSIGSLQSLQELYLMRNRLQTLPASLFDLQSLRILVLAINLLSSIPELIGNLRF